MNTSTLPKKINPDPIKDAIVELRFEPACPKQAVFGRIYEQFQKEYPEQKDLSIAQLPEKVRLTDPNLKYKPWYTMRGEKGVLSIGPDVLAINANCAQGYPGWDTFGRTVKNVVDNFAETNLVKNYFRIGVRYINFFSDQDIFKSIRLKVTYDDSKPFLEFPSRLITTKHPSDISVRILADNGVSIAKNKESSSSQGSILDLDASQHETSGIEASRIWKIIDKAHSEEKKQFFDLLNPEFLEELNPTY